MMRINALHHLIWRLSAAAVLLVAAGCPKPPQAVQQPKTSERPLVLLVADDPELGKAIAREWQGRTEQELTVRDVSLSEIAAASRLPADVVIFPAGWLGQLAERDLIVPLDPAALDQPEFEQRDIFEHVRLREMRWGGKTLATALGSPQFLLCYRADVFEKLDLKPPTTWTEYQQLAERLADRANLGTLAPAEGKPWQGAIEPLADGWAGQWLLARAAAYALHREQVSPLFRFDSLQPLIAEPSYVRALEELVAAAPAAGSSANRSTGQEAFAALCRGECAMAIGWPSGQADPALTVAPNIAFAPLPGAREAYRMATKTWETRGEDESISIPLLGISGRLAAVTSSSADARRATGFVIWLAGRDVSAQLAPHSAATTLFRNSQVAASGRWTPALSAEASRQYAETLAGVLTAPRVFPPLNLPGRPEYLAALDAAVHQALAGQPAKLALANAAQRWQETTDKLGLEKQRRANQRSLGLEKL